MTGIIIPISWKRPLRLRKALTQLCLHCKRLQEVVYNKLWLVLNHTNYPFWAGPEGRRASAKGGSCISEYDPFNPL